MTYYSELASLFVIIAVNLLLIGTPIAVAIFVVLRLTRAVAPRARYMLTLTAFFAAAILPFVVTVALPGEPPPDSTTVEHSNIDSATIPHEPVDIQAGKIEVSTEPERNVTTVNILNSLIHSLSQPSLSIGLLTLWLIGAGLLLAREAVSHLTVAKARRHWTPANANIRSRLSWPEDIPLFVDNEIGPCVLGVLNSVVILPAGIFDELSDSAAQQIARHELDHLKWRDPSVHAVMRIVRALLWPSAPLWYLARAAGLEREAASDRAAISSMSGRAPNIAAMEYASTLVLIARRFARAEGRQRYSWIATDFGNESGLNERVQRLMAVSSRPSRARLSLAFVALLISACGIAFLPVARLEAKMDENSDPPKEQQQAALTNPTRVEAEPPKGRSKKPPAPSSVNSMLGEAQQRPIPLPTQPVEKPDSSTPVGAGSTVQAVADLQLDILKREMAALGYTDLTPRQLADMRAYAVGPGYVAEMAASGYSGLSADMLIRFKWFAVSSSYIREMKTLGYDNLSPETMMRFREYAITADYIRQMQARISGSISGEQMASLRFYGASTEFVDKLKQMGYGNLNAEQLISMRLQGVSIAFIEGLMAQGRKGLSADELIAIRMGRSN